MEDASNQARSLGAKLGGAAREKYWEEKTDAEKIAALRDAVASLSRDNQEMTKTLQALLRHGHAPDGALTQPIAEPYSNGPIGYARDLAWSLRTKRERGNTDF